MGSSQSMEQLDQISNECDPFAEELKCLKFVRQTMLSLAVGEDEQEFKTFCQNLIELPNEKRFSFAFDFFESIAAFPEIERKPMKSSEEAGNLRKSGNFAHRQRHFIEALKLYTKCISVAPAGSSDLALAFGNRSAALFELKRYEGCIVDINRALAGLNEDCPETTEGNLLNRKQRCSMMMELFPVGGDNQKHEMEKNRSIDEDAKDLDYSGKFPTPEVKLKNENIPCASNKIKIAVDSTFGHHVVAAEDIEIGEIISVEKAYTSILFSNYRYSHCANCFIRCEVLIPCPNCSLVMYCSQCCLVDDFNRSHQIECQFYLHSYCLGLPLSSSFQLAIKTLIVVTKQGENLEKLMKDPLTENPLKPTPNAVPEKLCPQNDIHRILSLLNDDSLYSCPYDSSNLSEAPLSFYCGFLMSYILKKTTYFDAAMAEKTQVDMDSSKERKYVGTLFYKLTLSLPRYCSGIEELLQNEVRKLLVHVDGRHSVGRGFYLFHSLFNHSCHKNVTESQHKDTVVSRAVQPIKAGKQLFLSYGPNFLLESRKDRQEQLRSDYQFNCCCVACVEDWPILEKLESLPDTTNYPELTQLRHEFDEFLDSQSRLIEYNKKWFDFFRVYLKIFEPEGIKPIRDYSIAFIMFDLLLQSQGNNYVHTRDKIPLLL